MLFGVVVKVKNLSSKVIPFLFILVFFSSKNFVFSENDLDLARKMEFMRQTFIEEPEKDLKTWLSRKYKKISWGLGAAGVGALIKSLFTKKIFYEITEFNRTAIVRDSEGLEDESCETSIELIVYRRDFLRPDKDIYRESDSFLDDNAIASFTYKEGLKETGEERKNKGNLPKKIFFYTGAGILCVLTPAVYLVAKNYNDNVSYNIMKNIMNRFYECREMIPDQLREMFDDVARRYGVIGTESFLKRVSPKVVETVIAAIKKYESQENKNDFKK